jgi:aminoglycoside N3'-acetyltransferase
LLPKSLKRAVKNQKKVVETALLRRRFGFSASDLFDAIRNLGVRSGDAVLVHSSLDQFAAFEGKATEINSALLRAVGERGQILMPTLPFSGTAIDYAATNPVFDVKRTPSRTGLLTELFRRTPGVERSVHPTHSTAVSGMNARQFIADHHLATTPCGRGTPYARLYDAAGKILFMGTDISVMTFYHFIEEDLESRMPFSPFTAEFYTLRSRDADGNELLTRTRLFNPVYSRKRNLEVLQRHLQKAGRWNEFYAGNVKLILLDAHDVMTACRDLAQHGIYCYDA